MNEEEIKNKHKDFCYNYKRVCPVGFCGICIKAFEEGYKEKKKGKRFKKPNK